MSMDLDSYLMGIFDGEGCISARVNKRGNIAGAIIVCMSSEEIIRLFIKRWGGGYHKRTKLSAGGLQLHQWFIAFSSGMEFLRYAIQHSITKREQASIALELGELMAKYRHGNGNTLRIGKALKNGATVIPQSEKMRRLELVLKMRELNGGRNRFQNTNNGSMSRFVEIWNDKNERKLKGSTQGGLFDILDAAGD